MQQIISSSTMRMTSREIAELVGSRHDKVKQSIERLATDKENKPAVICLPPLVEYLDSLGRPVRVSIFRNVCYTSSCQDYFHSDPWCVRESAKITRHSSGCVHTRGFVFGITKQ